MAGIKSKRDKRLGKLPESRIKTIMRSSPEVENIGKDALFLVNKATELFIHHITKSAYVISSNKRELHYNDVAEVVQTNEIMSFLREIMPRTITLAQYEELMAAKGIPIEYESSEDEENEEDNEDDEQEYDYSDSEERYENSGEVIEVKDEDDDDDVHLESHSSND